MITVCFVRALQRCTGRLQMGFRFIFQAVRPIGKTRNQLLKTFPPTRTPGATLCPIACYVPVMCPLCDDFPLGVAQHSTVVTMHPTAQSGVAEHAMDARVASVESSEAAVHETTGVRVSSSNGP
jgi:hypothetical protein